MATTALRSDAAVALEAAPAVTPMPAPEQSPQPMVAAIASPAAAQGDTADQAAIRRALTQWMEDFNAGRADKVCALFAPDLIAQYRGQPERGYEQLCDLLKRSLADRGKSYRYALAIKEIVVEGDLAAVRLTWTLTVRGKGTPSETTTEEPAPEP